MDCGIFPSIGCRMPAYHQISPTNETMVKGDTNDGCLTCGRVNYCSYPGSELKQGSSN